MRYIILCMMLALCMMPGLAKQENIQVGNHTVSMNIPDYPQYYISSTVLDNQEAVEIVFNQSLLRTLFVGPQSININIYNYRFGRNETTGEMLTRITYWGDENYPGNCSIYTKDLLGSKGVVVEHPYSATWNGVSVLDANAYIDRDSSGKAYALVEIISDYDRVVTGAIIDSMKIETH